MWRYTLADLKPDDDPEAWARQIADEGCLLWIPGNNGADTIVGDRHVRRYSLRRWTGNGPPPAEIEWDQRPPRRTHSARGRTGDLWTRRDRDPGLWTQAQPAWNLFHRSSARSVTGPYPTAPLDLR